MHVHHSDPSREKSWLTGAWDSGKGMVVPGQPPPVNIGYANRGVDDPHLPTCITEIYLVGRGSAQVRIEQQDVTLDAGDLLVIEPGEDARTEKVLVSRERLGLS